MKKGTIFNGSRIKWVYQNPQKINKYEAFVRSNVNDLINWLLILIGVFLFVARNILPTKEILLTLLLLGLGLANSYSNTMGLIQDHNSTYGYTKDFIFMKNGTNDELKLIPFNEIYEIDFKKFNEEKYTLTFYTYHIGTFNKSLTKAKIAEFRSVKISKKEIQYLKTKIEVK